MKTIKIIDLLNMIAEGKEIPKRIKYNKIVYSYCDLDTSYNNEEYTRDLFSVYDIPSILNDTVEIIEETTKEELANRIENALEFLRTQYNSFPSGEMWREALKKVLEGKEFSRYKTFEDNNKIEYLEEKDFDDDIDTDEKCEILREYYQDLKNKVDEIIDKINKK